jgi:(1->4)-alpha-D-glucan 1-alpha-D-glucosylmutase
VTAPLSTYRVQLQPAFPFSAAASLVDYLAALGVSHFYASPILQPAAGSTHGYDVVDHSRANDEIGGEEGRRGLVTALREHGLGMVLDIVPNHMSVAAPRQNRWWWDVLRHGSASPYAGWFDIDWDAPYAAHPTHRGRLLVPVLGSANDVSALRLVEDDGELLLAYYDKRFPVADGTASPGDGPAAAHDRQHYVLADWRIGNDALNYRRFFDVTDLAAVRVEDARVFERTHEAVLRWVADGDLDGLRIDHPDGLADPEEYLRRLAAAAPDAWVVVEKILEPGERLDERWPTAGTTGYDAMREVGGLLVDPAGEKPLTTLYAELTGEPTDFGAIVVERKRAAALTVLRAETARLAVLLERAGVVDEWPGAVEPLAEMMARVPVYRSYARPGYDTDDGRLAVLDEATDAASAARPEDDALYRGIRDALRLALDEPGPARDFLRRLQQTTGMVMAKGVEDTAFYRYHRLVSLNEVGGDPAEFGVSVEAFHTHCAERQRLWPYAMTSLSTHDTKRSEDVRARLAVLSELPDEWRAAVTRWGGMAERHRSAAGPDANIEYLFWQTLVGAWPIDADRLVAYVEKASREAKQRTSWVDRDEAYDTALAAFVRGVLDDESLRADVGAFVDRVLGPGRVIALTQKLVQLTMPGVPDVYQGTECWDLSLVDPDNRRPVDFAARRELLARLDADGASVPDVRDDSGLAKLLVTSRALRLRRERPEWFGAEGSYAPVGTSGSAAEHVVAFSRAGSVVTVGQRLPVGLSRRGGWGDTTLALPAAGVWRDALTGARHTGERLALADVLARFPVALLVPHG